MSFFDSFTGSSQRKDIRNGQADFNRSSRRAQDYTKTYAGNAANYLTPYHQQGQQANTMYGNALGVNGDVAQQGYWDNYAADPQRQYDEDRSVDAVGRSMAARGMSRSGMAALAGARASQDVGRSYTQDRLNRLQGYGQQGYSAANQLANIELGTGNALAGYEIGIGKNNQAANMGLASTRNMGFNNLMSVAGLGVGGFTPTASGQSAFGNMATGMNRLF